jgi:CDP-glucose 4,6-dehydratase
MRRALLTGANGFVGPHLARALLERGDAVTALELSPRPDGGLALHGIRDQVELIEADLRDPERVEAALGGRDFDVVFHLAGQTVAGPALIDPAATFEANVAGTWVLLEACRQAEIPAVVVASSVKAYGPSAGRPLHEGMQLRPDSPHGASKAAKDEIALSYFPAYGLPVGVIRFSNIYGGGDPNFSRLVPEAIVAVLEGRRPAIRSDGSPERDFLYVADAVSAYLAVEEAAEAGGPAAGEVFNAGGSRLHSVAEVLETIAEVSGSGLAVEYLNAGDPGGEGDRQFVDSTKLRELTGWAPRIPLHSGLTDTLAWYREHPQLRPVLPASGAPT